MCVWNDFLQKQNLYPHTAYVEYILTFLSFFATGGTSTAGTGSDSGAAAGASSGGGNKECGHDSLELHGSIESPTQMFDV